MSTQPKKRARKKGDLDGQIEAAIQDGLSEDKSGIDSKPVYRELVESSKPQYAAMMDMWRAYVRRFPGSDPCSMEDMKHFAETVARATPARLDKKLGKPTVKSIQNKMRKFMSAWERDTGLAIPKHAHDSMCPYIKNVLRWKIPLSIEEKASTFLTIENYVHMQELFWQNDHHTYVHEGVRVYLAAVLDMQCYCAARLQEICMAKYKDLLCMVGWKDGEPEIKISFKRDFAKGMQDTPKKPKRPLYERLNPTPPLFANSILFLLAIFISAGAFRDFHTISGVLDARPMPKENFWIMEWADNVLEDPVFPEISRNGPIKKAKNKNAWGKQCSDWAIRAGFVGGMGLHATRREELIKVDDGGYSLGQVMKFAGHRNPKTLVGHYLSDMSNVDGAAAFLGLEQRRDVTEDFRSASMKRIPDLPHSLPAKVREELEQRPEYASLCEQIEGISLRTKDAVTEDARDTLKAQLTDLYYRRRRLREDELKRHQRNQRRVYNAQRGAYYEGDWRRSHFDRVIRHMVPERDRLADTLALAVPLRSPQGISALQDLVALLVNDSRVAYQDVFRPAEGRCPVPSCAVEIESIPLQGRWDHVYRCRKGLLKAKHGFAKFCFLCNVWMTSAADWETHCQDHIDDMDVPFRCNAVTFRRALARAAYCPRCLGNTRLSAATRMRHFKREFSWNRHISKCIPDYAKSLPNDGTVPCPHGSCPTVPHSESALWHHLGDIHSTHKPNVGTKRKGRPDVGEEDDDEEAETSDAAKRRRRLQSKLEGGNPKPPTRRISAPKSRSEDLVGLKFIHFKPNDLDSSLAAVIDTAAAASSGPSSRCSTTPESTWTKSEHSSASTPLSSMCSEIPIDLAILPPLPAPDLHNIEVMDPMGVDDALQRKCPVKATIQSAYRKPTANDLPYLIEEIGDPARDTKEGISFNEANMHWEGLGLQTSVDGEMNSDRVTTSEDEALHLNHHAQGAVLKQAGEGHPMNDAGVLEHARLPAKDLDDIQTADPQLLTTAMLPRSPGQAIDATVLNESMTLAEEKCNFLRGTSNISEFMVADQVQA